MCIMCNGILTESLDEEGGLPSYSFFWKESQNYTWDFMGSVQN